jgi:hypothetical protein
MIQLYATHTGTRRNLSAMQAAGIRLLLGPDQLGRVNPNANWGWRYALDNGAWSAFNAGRAFDAAAFWRVLEQWGDTFDVAAARRGHFPGSAQRPDWIVCPDIVAGGLRSLDLSLWWLPYVRQYGHPLIAVQDGMLPEHIEEYIGPRCGIFLGGSTAWKWATLPTWGAMARLYRAHLHVGRVNSERAVRLCASVGAASCDGTSPTRFAVNSPKLGRACVAPAQGVLDLRGLPL